MSPGSGVGRCLDVVEFITLPRALEAAPEALFSRILKAIGRADQAGSTLTWSGPGWPRALSASSGCLSRSPASA